MFDKKSCINCNQPLKITDNFCPECGQSTTNKLNLKVLFSDLIGNYLSFDARFFKTIIPLLIKPGFVAKAFVNGKRKTYLHPAKIYLFISVLFFFVLSIKTSSFRSEINENVFDEISENININDSIKSDSLVIDTNITPHTSLGLDSVSNIKAPPNTDGNYSKYLNSDNFVVRQIGKILQKKGFNLFDTFFGMISIAIFLLVPIYAFFLNLLFFKNYTFTQHLVFSLYLFAFGFLISILYLSLYNLDDNSYITLIISLLFLTYLSFSFKHFYEQSLKRSIIKACIQSTIFIIVLVPTTFVLLIISSILIY